MLRRLARIVDTWEWGGSRIDCRPTGEESLTLVHRGRELLAVGCLRDLVVERHAVPAELHVVDGLAPRTVGGRVPQRDRGEVLEEDLLRLLELLDARFDVGLAEAFLEERVELGVGVVTVVRAGTGLVDRAEEVRQRR